MKEKNSNKFLWFLVLFITIYVGGNSYLCYQAETHQKATIVSIESILTDCSLNFESADEMLTNIVYKTWTCFKEKPISLKSLRHPCCKKCRVCKITKKGGMIEYYTIHPNSLGVIIVSLYHPINNGLIKKKEWQLFI